MVGKGLYCCEWWVKGYIVVNGEKRVILLWMVGKGLYCCEWWVKGYIVVNGG